MNNKIVFLFRTLNVYKQIITHCFFINFELTILCQFIFIRLTIYQYYFAIFWTVIHNVLIIPTEYFASV